MPAPAAMVSINPRTARRIGHWTDAEEAIDSADEAANHSTDESSNRTSRLRSDISAMLDAIRHALCLRRKRACDGCGNEASKQDL